MCMCVFDIIFRHRSRILRSSVETVISVSSLQFNSWVLGNGYWLWLR